MAFLLLLVDILVFPFHYTFYHAVISFGIYLLHNMHMLEQPLVLVISHFLNAL